MRHLIALFGLLLIAFGCSPTPPDSVTTNIADSLQFQKNISTLYGSGGKNVKDNSGLVAASNIIWKDSLGNTHSLNGLKGKIVLLNFWAIWCSPCEAEMPDLNSIAESSTDILVIGVSALDPSSLLFQRSKLFIETRGLKYQFITDQASKTYVNYGGDGTIPRSYAIDRDGHIAYTFIGQRTKKQFMDILNQIP